MVGGTGVLVCESFRDRATRSDKTVSATSDRGDVPSVRTVISEHLSQRANVESEATFIDDLARPHFVRQFSLGHDILGPLNERDEDFEGATTYFQVPAITLEAPLGTEEPKGTERNCLAVAVLFFFNHTHIQCCISGLADACQGLW
jgi:hypothetical protein